MIINQVGMKNLKGLNRTVDLGAKTLVTGPNGSGKTALRQALGLTLWGLDPVSGYRKNGELIALSPCSDMIVEARFDSGLTIRREYMLKPGAGVSSRLVMDPEPDITTNAAAQTALNDLLGQEPMCLDPGAAAKLSDPAVMEFLFEVLPVPEAWTRSRVLEVAGLSPDGDMESLWNPLWPFKTGFLTFFRHIKTRFGLLLQKRREADAALKLLNRHDPREPESNMSPMIRQELGGIEAELGTLRELLQSLGPGGIMGRIAAQALELEAQKINGVLEILGICGEIEIRIRDHSASRQFKPGLFLRGFFRPMGCLSAGERIIFCSALLIALAPEERKFKFLVVDDLNLVDNISGGRERFLAGLFRAVDLGLMDQVMALSSEPVSVPPGANLIRLQSGTERGAGK